MNHAELRKLLMESGPASNEMPFAHQADVIERRLGRPCPELMTELLRLWEAVQSFAENEDESKVDSFAQRTEEVLHRLKEIKP